MTKISEEVEKLVQRDTHSEAVGSKVRKKIKARNQGTRTGNMNIMQDGNNKKSKGKKYSSVVKASGKMCERSLQKQKYRHEFHERVKKYKKKDQMGREGERRREEERKGGREKERECFSCSLGDVCDSQEAFSCSFLSLSLSFTLLLQAQQR